MLGDLGMLVGRRQKERRVERYYLRVKGVCRAAVDLIFQVVSGFTSR